MYSSPGLDLRQKQLLTCAFLAEAAMPDQLFGHALAGLRCGWGGANSSWCASDVAGRERVDAACKLCSQCPIWSHAADCPTPRPILSRPQVWQQLRGAGGGGGTGLRDGPPAARRQGGHPESGSHHTWPGALLSWLAWPLLHGCATQVAIVLHSNGGAAPLPILLSYLHHTPADQLPPPSLPTAPQAYAKYCKDMAGAAPTCPEVEIIDPETSICLPPLPPLVNPPAQQPPAQQQDAAVQGVRRQSTEEDPLAAAADASVSVSTSQDGGLKPAGGSRTGGGWGTSNLGRPTALAGEAQIVCGGGGGA